MTKAQELYIDDEGVLRGFYVYLHRQTIDGQVFYVGKRSGYRAWNTTDRNTSWKERVAELGDAWEVVIAKDDLSEIEAFELEEELVEQYGGCAHDGGPLTNLMPGGEEPMSTTIAVNLGPKTAAWNKAYYDAREFKKLPRQRQDEIALQVMKCLDPISHSLDDLMDVAEEEDEELDRSISDLQCFVDSLFSFAHDFSKRRTSWKAFAMDFEMMLDDLDADDIEDLHAKVRPLAEAISPQVRELFEEIDTGNRQEAEEIAQRAAEALRDD